MELKSRNNMKLRKNKHSVHSIGYHIVFCPKYRHQVLTGAIEIEAKRKTGKKYIPVIFIESGSHIYRVRERW